MLISFAASRMTEGARLSGEERRVRHPNQGAKRSPADSASPVKCTFLLAHYCCDLFFVGKGRTPNNCFFFLTKKDDVQEGH